MTIQATVTEVKTGRGGVTFLDMGGSFPDNAFAAMIFASDLAKFPGAKTLKGKTVAISGEVVLYQDGPEIILKTADQLKTNYGAREGVEGVNAGRQFHVAICLDRTQALAAAAMVHCSACKMS